MNVLVRKSGERCTAKICDIMAYQKMLFLFILSQSRFDTTQEQWQKIGFKISRGIKEVLEHGFAKSNG